MANQYLDSAGLTVLVDEILNKIEEAKSTVTCVTIHNLPTIGKEDTDYIIEDENAIYRWDDDELKYYCIGRDYNNIEIISGGNGTE